MRKELSKKVAYTRIHLHKIRMLITINRQSEVFYFKYKVRQYRCLSWSATEGSEQISSKVSCGFNPKNFRNSFKEPRFQALDCCMPRIVMALRQVGMLLGPKAPANAQRIEPTNTMQTHNHSPAVSSIELVKISTSSSSENLPSAPRWRSAKGRFCGSFASPCSHFPRP